MLPVLLSIVAVAVFVDETSSLTNHCDDKHIFATTHYVAVVDTKIEPTASVGILRLKKQQDISKMFNCSDMSSDFPKGQLKFKCVENKMDPNNVFKEIVRADDKTYCMRADCKVSEEYTNQKRAAEELNAKVYKGNGITDTITMECFIQGKHAVYKCAASGRFTQEESCPKPLCKTKHLRTKLKNKRLHVKPRDKSAYAAESTEERENCEVNYEHRSKDGVDAFREVLFTCITTISGTPKWSNGKCTPVKKYVPQTSTLRPCDEDDDVDPNEEEDNRLIITIVLVGLVLGVLFIVFLGLTFVFAKRRRHRRRHRRRDYSESTGTNFTSYNQTTGNSRTNTTTNQTTNTRGTEATEMSQQPMKLYLTLPDRK